MMNQYFKYTLLLCLLLPITGCKQQYKLTDSKSVNKKINNKLSTNDFSETIISPYRAKLASKMNEVINTSLIDMEVGTPEGLLGNFVCDLTYIKAKEISDKTTNERWELSRDF